MGKIGDTFGMVAFFVTIGAIDVDGYRASARGYVREIATMADGGLYKVVGRYDDELIRVDGAWRFARRAYSALIRENGTALP